MSIAPVIDTPRRPGFFRHHVRWYQSLRPVPFLLAISAEGLAVSFLAACFLRSIYHSPGRADFNVAADDAFWSMCVIAPLWETVLCQLLPIGLLRWLQAPTWLIVGASAAWFMFLHTGAGPEVAIAAGAVGGIYFAFTFAHWVAARGYGMAYGITAGSHFLHNLVAFSIILVCGGFEAPTLEKVSANGQELVYVTDSDGTFLFAIATDGICGWFDATGNRLYGPFRVIDAAGFQTVSFDDEQVTINGRSFKLKQGRFFRALRDRNSGPTVEQHDFAVDPARFAADPAGQMRAFLQTMPAAQRQ